MLKGERFGNSHPIEIDCDFLAFSEFDESNPQYNLTEGDVIFLVIVRDVVLTKKVWEHIQKIAILKQLKVILKQNVRKAWERRSHNKKKEDCTK